jgi:PIN domain nuclease of toxin-antitoxin system
VRLADMSPDLLIAASFLPGKPPRDPADRIIAATARDLGAALITRDRALIARTATSAWWRVEQGESWRGEL